VGQTGSGLYNIFFKGCDGLAGFVGPFGESIIDTPTPEQAKYIKNQMGALEYLQEKRALAIKNGNMEELSILKRQNPLNFKEAFTPPPMNEYFDSIILEQNILDLMMREGDVLIGNFGWAKERFGKVVWINDETNGRFVLSKRLVENESNQQIIIDGKKFPRFPDRFVASADAFRVEKTEGGRMSMGGGCVRWLFDSTVDSLEKPIDQWESCRTVCDYLARPGLIEYQEDMLMMSIWFGALMYPENNITHVSDFFKENGFEGYLLYDTDAITGEPNNNPGFTTATGTKQEIFNLIANDIKRHGKRNRHMRIARQCMDIPDPDAMTHYDLFTAYGGTLLGEKSKLGVSMKEAMTEQADVSNWFDSYGFNS